MVRTEEHLVEIVIVKQSQRKHGFFLLNDDLLNSPRKEFLTRNTTATRRPIVLLGCGDLLRKYEIENMFNGFIGFNIVIFNGRKR